MSNARNISKAESRFVNATGDTLSGACTIDATESENIRLYARGYSAAIPLRIRNMEDVANAQVALRFQGVDNSASDTVYTDFVMDAENRKWGIGFGTSSASLPVGHADGIDPHCQIIGHDSGYVQMPYQPAFYATFNGDGNIGNMDIVHSTYTNVGNHFNTSNGAFTAPIDGVYLFNADVMTQKNSGASHGLWYFTINGVNQSSLHHSHADSTESYRNTSGSAVLSLSANDVVRVKTYSSPAYWTVNANGWSGFSGYLLG